MSVLRERNAAAGWTMWTKSRIAMAPTSRRLSFALLPGREMVDNEFWCKWCVCFLIVLVTYARLYVLYETWYLYETYTYTKPYTNLASQIHYLKGIASRHLAYVSNQVVDKKECYTGGPQLCRELSKKKWKANTTAAICSSHRWQYCCVREHWFRDGIHSKSWYFEAVIGCKIIWNGKRFWWNRYRKCQTCVIVTAITVTPYGTEPPRWCDEQGACLRFGKQKLQVSRLGESTCCGEYVYSIFLIGHAALKSACSHYCTDTLHVENNMSSWAFASWDRYFGEKILIFMTKYIIIIAKMSNILFSCRDVLSELSFFAFFHTRYASCTSATWCPRSLLIAAMLWQRAHDVATKPFE